MRRLLLVRHGQSTWNVEGRWQGQADPPLSELGERQARAAAPAVAALDPSLVVTSDLARASRTAELLMPSSIAPIVHPSLREREAGEWTGLTTAEIDEKYPGFRTERKSPLGFEDDASLLTRVLPALHAVAARLGRDSCALVVTHVGVIRTVEGHVGERSPAIPNLGGRWFHVTDDGLALGEPALLLDPDIDNVTTPTSL